MRTTKPISAAIISCIIAGVFCIACEDLPNSIDLDVRAPGLAIIEDGNNVHVLTPDDNLMLTFEKEDFDNYQSEFNIKNRMTIESHSFNCQKDEFFSNRIWVIKPYDLTLDKPVKITLHYTHEELAPEGKTDELKIYLLKREYVKRKEGDTDQPLMRVSDMSMILDCDHHDEDMKVSADILKFGGFVIGRAVK